MLFFSIFSHGILLEKLVKKFFVLYEAQGFLMCHQSLSWTRQIQSTFSQPTYPIKTNFNIILPTIAMSHQWSDPFRFLTKIF
jgi:uncharacterized protein YggT (Ycf19 family)